MSFFFAGHELAEFETVEISFDLVVTLFCSVRERPTILSSESYVLY